MDSKYPHATQEFIDLLPDPLSEDRKRRIFRGNALDFPRDPEEDLPTVFHEAVAARS